MNYVSLTFLDKKNMQDEGHNFFDRRHRVPPATHRGGELGDRVTTAIRTRLGLSAIAFYDPIHFQIPTECKTGSGQRALHGSCTEIRRASNRIVGLDTSDDD
jgi:hypothetical protein